MKSVCVLGGGQLGQMLKQAGEVIGVDVILVDEKTELKDVINHLGEGATKNCVITAEVERWHSTNATNYLSSLPNFINKEVFKLIADRLTQKQLFDSLNLPTAKWAQLQNATQINTLFDELGEKLIIKRRVGGYDGKGQYRITKQTINTLPLDAYQQAIVEQSIHFSDEVSIIGARNKAGETVFYPLTYNYHQEGILMMSVPSKTRHPLQHQAQTMLNKIMTALNYVGVMVMECFVVNDALLINELAPRVHNSGHWTQGGASINQFELHLRAILDLPLPKPAAFNYSVMINLIGEAYNLNWLKIPLAQVHWYKKEVRAGRKLGHINVIFQDKTQIKSSLDNIISLLPPQYINAANWAKNQLNGLDD